MSGQKPEANYTTMKTVLSAEVNTAFDTGELDGLKSKWNSFETKEAEKRTALEQALRDKVIELLYDENRTVDTLNKFMEFLLLLWNNELVFPLTPVSIIGDILDSTPIPLSEVLFEFVEKRVSLWKSQPFFTPCKNNILRMCNDLLRRLSKAQNTDFCGRILLFLAMFFPFSERSGLNIVSEFNIDTCMKYGIEEDDLIEGEPLQTVDIPIKLDTNFYSEFWSLQEYFRSPMLCYLKKQWKDFVKNSNAVLTVFKNYKLDWDAETSNMRTSEDNFFTKFLTNQKLLLLQLNDTNFRRTIYLQFLILFQFLSLPKPKDSHTLKSDQLEWVKTSAESIHQLIKESPPDGEKFLQAVQLILKREEHWSNWKGEGCPPLKKITQNYDKNAVIKSPPKKETMANVLHQTNNFNKLIVPRSDRLEVIDMRQDYLKYLPGRNCSPQVTDFLAECIQQSESPEPIDIKDKKVSDPQYGWIALKLLSLKSPHFFSTNTQNPIPKLPEFVDHICRKIYREQNPGLLLPPLLPAPKTISKAEAKKEGVKVLKGVNSNESKVQQIKLQKGQIKIIKTQSGKLIKLNAVTNTPIKTIKLGDKTRQIASTAAKNEKLSKSPEKNLEKLKSESNDKTESKDKMDKSERVEKEKSERHDKVEKTDKTLSKVNEKSDKDNHSHDKHPQKLTSSKVSNSDKLERNDKHEKNMSSTKVDKSKIEKEKKVSEKKTEKLVEKTEKNNSSSNNKEKERNSEKQFFKKEKSPGKRKRSHDNDSDDKESSPANTKKTKDKRDERKDEKEDDSITCPVLTKELIARLAKSISGSWKKVAEKLGYKPDEVEYFESQKDSDYTRAVNLLLVWCSTEDDATPENLRQSLKNLGLLEAVKILSAS
ncbi:THO complex subunit 1 [Cimex lectularius]|uniref:Death domain-containing protein n=1 Tax=Cimex lectularius TaxID=79782 RepID=A0A8I6S7U5_CIMLE|nr:THO complex subunit 1 [Cimex lectularius]